MRTRRSGSLEVAVSGSNGGSAALVDSVTIPVIKPVSAIAAPRACRFVRQAEYPMKSFVSLKQESSEGVSVAATARPTKIVAPSAASATPRNLG